MKPIIYLLFAILLMGIASAEDLTNITFTFDNGGKVFIYDAVSVVSYSNSTPDSYAYFEFNSPQPIYNTTASPVIRFLNYSKEINFSWANQNFSIGCFVPIENVTPSNGGYFKSCSGTYQLNDTEGNGAIIIGADNVTLDCGGASLVGNHSANSIGINISSTATKNIKITNCNISGYNDSAIRLSRETGLTNLNITNNIISDTVNPIRMKYPYNSIISGNNISCQLVSYFYGMRATPTIAGISITLGINDTLSNNYIDNCGIGIKTLFQTKFTNITNNTFGLVDTAIRIWEGYNYSVTNNLILNASENGDLYSVCFDLYSQQDRTRGGNGTIANNICNYGSHGIIARKNDDLNIYGNTWNLISPLPTTGKWSNSGVGDSGEPPCAIRLTPYRKGTIDNSGFGESPYYNFSNSKVYNLTDYRVQIYDNSFSGNTQCYLWNQNASITRLELPSYKYRHFDSIDSIEYFH